LSGYFSPSAEKAKPAKKPFVVITKIIGVRPCRNGKGICVLRLSPKTISPSKVAAETLKNQTTYNIDGTLAARQRPRRPGQQSNRECIYAGKKNAVEGIGIEAINAATAKKSDYVSAVDWFVEYAEYSGSEWGDKEPRPSFRFGFHFPAFSRITIICSPSH
jgi:hypothetical protein